VLSVKKSALCHNEPHVLSSGALLHGLFAQKPYIFSNIRVARCFFWVFGSQGLSKNTALLCLGALKSKVKCTAQHCFQVAILVISGKFPDYMFKKFSGDCSIYAFAEAGSLKS
jgi:hypothetical protein